jgi:glutamate N-acetyltransferase/amino-acid N-acetyltransferase
LKSTGALDLTLIENVGPCFDAAAVYTSNKVVAAPVIWSREVTKGKLVRAAVLNSGEQMLVLAHKGLQILITQRKR